jgi:hypothetical protein
MLPLLILVSVGLYRWLESVGIVVEMTSLLLISLLAVNSRTYPKLLVSALESVSTSDRLVAWHLADTAPLFLVGVHVEIGLYSWCFPGFVRWTIEKSPQRH